MHLMGAAICTMQLGAKRLTWLLGKKSGRLALAAVAVVAAVKVGTYVQKHHRRKRWAEAGRDVVVLHMFKRGKACPNLSPFVLKLETYLRMANIKYEVDHEEPLGSKGKSPWITVNGKEFTDSQFIMEYLGSKFNKDFSSHLTEKERATAHAIRTMLEDHTLWAMVHHRYVQNNGRAILTEMNIPFILRLSIKFFVRRVKKICWLQGMGRHSPAEIECIVRQDLAAVSGFIGENDYLMGEKPTEVDCTVFGFLSQIIWTSSGSSYERMLETDYPSLHNYCLRMRGKFWPDWNACLDPPQPVS